MVLHLYFCDPILPSPQSCQRQSCRLDVDDYNDRNAIDMHFYYAQERSRQYWLLDGRDDGSVKTSNNYTETEIFLDIDVEVQTQLMAQ